MKRFDKIKSLLQSRKAKLICGVLAGLFVTLNLYASFVYHDRTLPMAQVNHKRLSNTKYGQIDKGLKQLNLLPDTLIFSYKDKSVSYKSSDVGLSVDVGKIIESSKLQRSWLPVYDLLTSPKLPRAIKINSTSFDRTFNLLSKTFNSDPSDAQIILQDGTFSLKKDVSGAKLNEATTKNSIQGALVAGGYSIQLKPEILAAHTRQTQLKPVFNALQKQQKTSITFRYQSKSKTLSAKDIGMLYVKSGDGFIVSDQLVKAKVTSIGSALGIHVQNQTEAESALKNSLAKNDPLDFSLVPLIATHTFRYCVQLKGVDESNRGAFASKLSSTYADQRGWSLGGQVTFVQSVSGCNFTAWLVASDQMPSFGAICDTNWSCTVSPNIVINFDRWSGASSAWNNGGGNLEDYRSMVINHETGHWLGFGHKSCTGAGQLAPIMQQQSIDLQGCKFNPWPLDSEVSTLRGWLGL